MTDLARSTHMARRDFVKALGGGILVLVSLPATGLLDPLEARAGRTRRTSTPTSTSPRTGRSRSSPARSRWGRAS